MKKAILEKKCKKEYYTVDDAGIDAGENVN